MSDPKSYDDSQLSIELRRSSAQDGTMKMSRSTVFGRLVKMATEAEGSSDRYRSVTRSKISRRDAYRLSNGPRGPRGQWKGSSRKSPMFGSVSRSKQWGLARAKRKSCQTSYDAPRTGSGLSRGTEEWSAPIGLMRREMRFGR